jgi:surfactin synthase thioesterase subunit
MEKWIKYRKKQNNPKCILICLHHAGGGASLFYKWQKIIGNQIEIWPVQLPGRENRIDDPLTWDYKEIVNELAEAIAPYLVDQTFAIFGHSMGGIIGFELAKKLINDYRLTPVKCFISSSRGFRENEKFDIDSMNDMEFLKEVDRYGGIPEELFKLENIRTMYVGIMRNDFKLVHTYVMDKTNIPDIPIRAYVGRNDKTVSIEEMKDWEGCTEGEVTYKSFEGDHFYLNVVTDQLCDDIREELINKCIERVA